MALHVQHTAAGALAAANAARAESNGGGSVAGRRAKATLACALSVIIGRRRILGGDRNE